MKRPGALIWALADLCEAEPLPLNASRQSLALWRDEAILGMQGA